MGRGHAHGYVWETAAMRQGGSALGAGLRLGSKGCCWTVVGTGLQVIVWVDAPRRSGCMCSCAQGIVYMYVRAGVYVEAWAGEHARVLGAHKQSASGYRSRRIVSCGLGNPLFRFAAVHVQAVNQLACSQLSFRTERCSCIHSNVSLHCKRCIHFV